MILIKIKATVTAEPSNSVNNFFKEFHFEGQSYVISGLEIKAFPDAVATAWLASDSDLELVERT